MGFICGGCESKTKDKSESKSKSKRVTLRKRKSKNKRRKMVDLNDDVLRRVLMRVPPKSLDGLRFVSKKWFNMISDFYFVQQHALFSSQHEHGIIIQEAVNPKRPQTYLIKIMKHGTVSKHYLPSVSKSLIYASCNGLLLVDTKSQPSDKLRVVNPTTMQQLNLPECLFPAFEFGFAFVPSTRQYKVVQITAQHTLVECAVLVLGTNSDWRLIDAPSLPFALDKCFRYRPISVNGVLYWIEYSQNTVISLDVAAEKFYQIPFPQDVGLSKGGFIGMGNFLCFLKYRHPDHLDIWLLEDFHKGEWVKHCTLTVHSRIIESMPVCSFQNGEIIIFRKRKTLWAYHVKHDRWTKCSNNDTPLSFWGPHVSSIVSPKFPAKRLE